MSVLEFWWPIPEEKHQSGKKKKKKKKKKARFPSTLAATLSEFSAASLSLWHKSNPTLKKKGKKPTSSLRCRLGGKPVEEVVHKCSDSALYCTPR